MFLNDLSFRMDVIGPLSNLLEACDSSMCLMVLLLFFGGPLFQVDRMMKCTSSRGAFRCELNSQAASVICALPTYQSLGRHAGRSR